MEEDRLSQNIPVHQNFDGLRIIFWKLDDPFLRLHPLRLASSLKEVTMLEEYILVDRETPGVRFDPNDEGDSFIQTSTNFRISIRQIKDSRYVLEQLGSLERQLVSRVSCLPLIRRLVLHCSVPPQCW